MRNQTFTTASLPSFLHRKGIGDFFPRFNKSVDEAKKAGITFLDLGWVDDDCQELTWEDLAEAVVFVHRARTQGGSVLIHCAQGRSRSTAVTLAYVATLLSSPLWGDALTTDDDAPFALAVKSKSTSIGSVPPPVSPVPGSNHQQPTNDGDCGSLPHEANSLIDIASQLVKNGRRMAQVNRNFERQLRAHADCGDFSRLAELIETG
mmetsp:Transcript_22809/g.51438  ORF Transcript_22809/g.51438 Transcript_22809/m.51438 type:complete len:206 (-) Transcript_22809:77-694(-)